MRQLTFSKSILVILLILTVPKTSGNTSMYHSPVNKAPTKWNSFYQVFLRFYFSHELGENVFPKKLVRFLKPSFWHQAGSTYNPVLIIPQSCDLN